MMSQKSLFDYSDEKVTIEVTDSKGEIIKTKVPASKVSQIPKGDHGKAYSTHYALDYIAKDSSFYDMRFWNSMSRGEVKKRFDSGEWKTNSGHGEWQLKSYVAQGGSFEALWKVIEANRLKFWKEQLCYWHKEVENHELELLRYENLQSCTGGCIACEKPCDRNRPTQFSPLKKPSEEHLQWHLDFHKRCIESAKETKAIYVKILLKHGLDPKHIITKQQKFRKARRK